MSNLRRMLISSKTTPIPPQQDAVVYDSFNRADGAPGISDSGHTWAQFSNLDLFSIKDGMLNQKTPYGDASITINSLCIDTEISVDFIYYKYGSIHFRQQNAFDVYRFRISSAGLGLFRIVGAAATSLGTYVFTPEVGRKYNLKVLSVYNNIKCYMDGVLIFDVYDNQFLTQTIQGLFSNSQDACYFDNYSVKSITSPLKYYYQIMSQSATVSNPNITFLSAVPRFVNGKKYRVRFDYSMTAYRSTTSTAYCRIYISNSGAFSFYNLRLQLVPVEAGTYSYTGSIDTVISATLTGTTLTLGARFDGQASDFSLTNLYIEDVV